MNLLALVEMVILVYRAQELSLSKPLGAVCYFLFFTWVFFNALNSFPWYPGKKGKLGIRLHFQKTLVPAAYLLALAFALKLVGASEWVLLPFGLFFLPMYYVAVILLWFHLRDKSDLMPGYFSHNFYLHKEDHP